MLKLIDLSLNGHILTMTVLIEGDANRAYQMSVDIKTERYSVVNSDIPSEYKIYERQAKTALRRYKGKSLPEIITSMWY